MFSTIKGYYENGRIVLQEEAPIQEKAEVMIIFVTNVAVSTAKQKRQPGGLKGKVSRPSDFNEPLDDFKDYM